MKTILAMAGAAVMGAVLFAAPSSAVTFVSGAGGGGQTCFYNAGGNSFTGLDANGMPTGLGGGADCVQVTRHPSWIAGVNAGVFEDPVVDGDNGLDIDPVWISYAQTGYQEAVLATPVGNTNPNQPTMVVTMQFDLAIGGLASLRQWSDDTVLVYVDGVLLPGTPSSPNFVQGTCAAGITGCEPGESSFGEVFLDAGSHVFTWMVWQVGTGGDTTSNPFGLLYAGQVNEVPAPGMAALLGLGLVGLATVRRRRRG